VCPVRKSPRTGKEAATCSGEAEAKISLLLFGKEKENPIQFKKV